MPALYCIVLNSAGIHRIRGLLYHTGIFTGQLLARPTFSSPLAGLTRALRGEARLNLHTFIPSQIASVPMHTVKQLRPVALIGHATRLLPTRPLFTQWHPKGPDARNEYRHRKYSRPHVALSLSVHPFAPSLIGPRPETCRTMTSARSFPGLLQTQIVTLKKCTLSTVGRISFCLCPCPGAASVSLSPYCFKNTGC